MTEQIIAWIAVYEYTPRRAQPRKKHAWLRDKPQGQPKRCYYTVTKRRQELLCSCGSVLLRLEDAHALEICRHLRALVDGKVIEKPLPKLPRATWVPPGLVDSPHASLSKDGEALLRWRWAATALRSP